MPHAVDRISFLANSATDAYMWAWNTAVAPDVARAYALGTGNSLQTVEVYGFVLDDLDQGVSAFTIPGAAGWPMALAAGPDSVVPDEGAGRSNYYRIDLAEPTAPSSRCRSPARDRNREQAA